jgi:hypothetical protein
MKAIFDVQKRLECALAGVGVLRTLNLTDETTTYRQFAVAIGLMAESEKWQAWHRQQVTDVLDLIAATEKKAGGNALDYRRIVNAQTGEPGAGVTRILKRKPPHPLARIPQESRAGGKAARALFRGWGLPG